MLSTVIKTSTLAKTAIVALTALSIGLTAPAPAEAFGRNERNFVQGAAAALLLGAVIRDANRHQRQPVYTQPRQRVYYDEPRYQPPRQQPQPYYAPAPSIYRTPVAQAFNSYSSSQRRAIQARLAAYGYYRSGIDGSFGPGTYNAVAAYARDTGNDQQLSSTAGAFGVFDALIY
ncbi:peptidoglycan-binding domain-containing protein [Rhodobacter ferrooxidans]|uniref:Peptidoglycan-binding domain 1 protein n=1 Tax=Rhodobacter ferrooxidans TaxID=371731 RepID=C8RW58_9RHOB|nr:peptidoglycan-binding domain-containing protein [Rhodobacter sp. SW2]EEW26801.1 Peptidoglycan-binding domain 1 protein [Rhodobacter sp. SW2]